MEMQGPGSWANDDEWMYMNACAFRHKVYSGAIPCDMEYKSHLTNSLNCTKFLHIIGIRINNKPFQITCQPIPRLRIDGGIGVALAYLDTAIKAPVDCSGHWTGEKLVNFELLNNTAINY